VCVEQYLCVVLLCSICVLWCVVLLCVVFLMFCGMWYVLLFGRVLARVLARGPSIPRVRVKRAITMTMGMPMRIAMTMTYRRVPEMA
jgi:hypothetical protein